ncbi:ABC transporter ATP-binding protein [uncultured Thiodictyon sp.]|uniref:ABC transporter ATP-binding protein n=1 Tax=uncultured Thiodictyon sp. TaxID=1846217 RepID=UPI0025EE45E9|nr:ABC transporter ATP-binding protein [uncultured Thiodictyon sp.]
MPSEEIAIRVDNLGKCYQIYERSQDRLKQSIVPRIRQAFGKSAPNYYREFWALRDVAFEVRKGESVGVIGRNGSGKSTLLQIVCGTLTPTTGKVSTSGRVAALLELGAGFNPEFTGRENVYLNGSVMGLTRAQIDERFDAIAAFADIGPFIEQAVKTYSTGMYVRLAFAIIAHVDADILVVDEALAVGDAIFIQKCMRFIRRFQENGALLFVSHDTSSVMNLCSRAIWLSNGSVRGAGGAKEVAEAYLQYTMQEVYGDTVALESAQPAGNLVPNPPKDLASSESAEESHPVDSGMQASIIDHLTEATGWKTGAAEILSVVVEKVEPGAAILLNGGDRISLNILAIAHQPLNRPILGFAVRDRLGQILFGDNTLEFTDAHPTPLAAGQRFVGKFVFRLPLLPSGQYSVTTTLANGSVEDHVQHHWLHDALLLNVSTSKRWGGLVGIPFEQVTLEPCT